MNNIKPQLIHINNPLSPALLPTQATQDVLEPTHNNAGIGQKVTFVHHKQVGRWVWVYENINRRGQIWVGKVEVVE